MSDELIERVARAVCERGGFDADQLMPNDGPRWRYYIDGARAAIEAIAYPKEWQPISTAPKEHGMPHVLLWGPHWLRPAVGFYMDRTDDWRAVTTKPFYHQPTYWQPLPTPPGAP